MNAATPKLAGAIARSLLLLALLSGCVEPRYLVTSAPEDPAAESRKADSLRSPAPTHTRRPVVAAHTEIVPLRLDQGFSTLERAKVLRAVNEWNHVLNGHVRLDIVTPPLDGAPATPATRNWLVIASRGLTAQALRGVKAQPLAITLRQPQGGGLVVVYIDSLAGRDLESVMRHELGHVLGLDHDSRGGLMAALYSPHEQQCVDRAAAEAIARLRKLPLDQLNWCEN